jgi:hypothetical protein
MLYYIIIPFLLIRAYRNPFTESQHLLILKSIQNVQLALKERGFDPLPVDLYDFYTPMYQYGQWL